MELMVQTTFDSQGLQHRLQKLIGSLNYKTPLKQSAEALKYESVKNIDTGGFYSGTFKPLKPATKLDRKRHGYKPARPILVRTGLLRNSFKVGETTDSAYLENKTSYAKYHQTGTKRGLPQRKIMGTSTQSRNAIRQYFVDFINSKIGK